MKYVLTGGAGEFHNWLGETRTSPTAARYIRTVDDLRGLTIETEDVVRYGTWYKRLDLYEIEDALAVVLRK